MKAVITSGNKQYVVKKDDIIEVDLLPTDTKTVTFEPLLVIADKDTKVGTPHLSGHTVTAEVLGEIKADKVTAIRYKAKKRVNKERGHRQRHTQLRITAVK